VKFNANKICEEFVDNARQSVDRLLDAKRHMVNEREELE